MKKKDNRVLVLLVTALTLMGLSAACGSKNSGDQNFAQVQDDRLEREWVQVGCTSSEDLAAFGPSRKISFVLLADQNLSRVETYYTASNCTDPAVTVTYMGKFKKEAENSQDGNIDLNYSRVVVKPINSRGVAALSSLKWCGLSEWYVGVDADVTTNGRTSSCTHPTLPFTVENRYRVEHEILFLGSNTLTVSGARPTTVNRSDPFHCPCRD